MLFHCANEQSPRLLSTLGYAPLSFVAEDANFLRATGRYGDIYPLVLHIIKFTNKFYINLYYMMYFRFSDGLGGWGGIAEAANLLL